MPNKSKNKILTQSSRSDKPWLRDLRLGTGLVLMTFLTCHLLNHALAIFGDKALEVGLSLQTFVWRSWLGTMVLYGAFLVHFLVALIRVASRNRWYLPRSAWVEIISGLLIPLFLIDHIVRTRGHAEVFGANDDYAHMFPLLTYRIFDQFMLVILCWVHGCLGIYYVYRWRGWFKRIKVEAQLVAVVLPLLALAGFIVGLRESNPELAQSIDPVALTHFNYYVEIFRYFIFALMAICGLFVLGRYVNSWRSGIVQIDFAGYGHYRVSRGLSILDAARLYKIPLPSRCGARARCSTCRVLIRSSKGPQPQPNSSENKVLKRIDAPAKVRLGCQFRPANDVSIQILTPYWIPGENSEEEAENLGQRRQVTVLAVNMRSFNALSDQLRPAEIMRLLNDYIIEMGQIIETHEGKMDMVKMDGFIVLFGLGEKPDEGATQALQSAKLMLEAVRKLDEKWADLAAIPLRIGIGIHAGPVIVAQMGVQSQNKRFGAFGETVSIAWQLEEATKNQLTDCILSREIRQLANIATDPKRFREISVAISGRNDPLPAYAYIDANPVAA